jgi:hypothetical protein
VRSLLQATWAKIWKRERESSINPFQKENEPHIFMKFCIYSIDPYQIGYNMVVNISKF